MTESGMFAYTTAKTAPYVGPADPHEDGAFAGIWPNEAEMTRMAHETALHLEHASGSEEMQILDTISVRGMQAVRRSSSTLDLLRVRIGDMLAHGNTADEIAAELVDLRAVLSQFGLPDTNDSLLGSLRRFLGAARPAPRSLKSVAGRYEEFAERARRIQRRLQAALTMLRRDNIELRGLYAEAEAEEASAVGEMFFAEALSRELKAVVDRATDAHKRERVQNAIQDVSTRIQDAQILHEIRLQFCASLAMTRDNNDRLIQAIEVTLNLLSNALAIGFTIQAALARHQRAPASAKRASELGDVHENAGAALIRLRKISGDLLDAIDTAESIKVGRDANTGERADRPSGNRVP